MADDGAFVSDNRKTGYGPKLTPERLIDGACERPIVADSCLAQQQVDQLVVQAMQLA